MTIGIDCRLSGIRHAGIGRYILNLVNRLPTLAPDLEWVWWFYDEAQAAETVNAPTVRKVIAPVRHYTLAEQREMPAYFHAANLDLLHVPHFNVPVLYKGAFMVTIHDLLWHEQRGTHVTTLPAWQYWLKYAVYRWVTTQAVSGAAEILVPAETIRQTVLHYYPQATEKITVTKEGATPLVDRPLTLSTHPSKPRLVYIGSLYPHKNIEVVLRALQNRSDLALTVIGSRSVFQEQVRDQAKEMGVDDRIEWAGYVPDTKLRPYLEKATALVQPSLSEGFGLTGVEAMMSGVPVVSSDIPIFHEIYGKAAFFFDPDQANALLAALDTLQKESRVAIRKRGLEQAAQYSWDTMASATVATYRRLLEKRG